MPDPFRLLLDRADLREPLFASDELAVWPPGVFEEFVAAGLLGAAASAGAVTCDACPGDHVEEVTFVQSPPGTPLRAYLLCPEEGRVPVPLERLHRWQVDLGCLARLAALTLETAGDVEEVVASRVWLLGKTTLRGQARDVFFCRGLTWVDGVEVLGNAARLQASVYPVVLVSGAPPARTIWAGDVPAVLPLSALASWDGGRLSIDRASIEQVVAGNRKAKPAALVPFPTPRGAVWEDVTLVVGELRLRVEVLDKWKHLTFQEAGFEERRRRAVPDRLWQLLRLLATHGGVLPLPQSSGSERRSGNLKQNMSQLGRRLQALLLIDGKPFKDSRMTRRYEARFKVAAEEGLRFPAPEGLDWGGVGIVEVRPGVVVVSADAAEAFGTYTAPDAEADTAGRWEAAVQAAPVQREYDLRSLGLADKDGRPTSAGEALVAVLRGGGLARRKANDKAMLTLGKLLSQLIQIDTSPFTFSLAQQEWSALFEASSSIPEASR